MHQPPIPQANTSPFPRAGEGNAGERQLAAATITHNLVERARVKKRTDAIGWAILGLGAVTAVAGLLLARRRIA